MFSQGAFDGWMNAKYAALAGHSTADLIRSEGAANEANARASVGIPAAARLERAQADTAVPATANNNNADAELRRAQAAQASALTGVINGGAAGGVVPGGTTADPFGAFTPRNASALGGSAMNTTMPFLGGMPSAIGQTFQQQPERYAKGTDKVPGKGDGTKDTVAADLAPGEAVLNRGAAEHLGRDNIKSLNALGMLHMGMIDPKGAKGNDTKDDRAKTSDTKAAPKDAKDDRAKPAEAKPAAKNPKDNRAHYVGGHSNVGKGKKSDTPKIDPQMLQQVMSMMGGGGMPQQAQQPQPLPGGMP